MSPNGSFGKQRERDAKSSSVTLPLTRGRWRETLKEKRKIPREKNTDAYLAQGYKRRVPSLIVKVSKNTRAFRPLVSCRVVSCRERWMNGMSWHFRYGVTARVNLTRFDSDELKWKWWSANEWRMEKSCRSKSALEKSAKSLTWRNSQSGVNSTEKKREYDIEIDDVIKMLWKSKDL